MTEEKPTLGSLFSFLFSEPDREQARAQYQEALAKAQHALQEMPEDANAEATLRMWGRAIGVDSWHSAKETN